MEDKHYERLGKAIRSIVERNERLGKAIRSIVERTEDNMTLGKLVLVSTEIMLIEAERDARDQANGKGDKE